MRLLFTLFLFAAILPADDLAGGKRLYEGHCAPCHGMKATGGKGPSLATPTLSRAADDEALAALIREGIPGTEMPPGWQMTSREITQVVAYIRSLGRVEVEALPGDASRGRTIYEGKGDCSSCHILRGGGTALGPELTNVGLRRNAAYLREALLDPEASFPDRFVMVRAVTSGGKEFHGVRLNEDSFTIQIQDGAGSFQSFRKSELKVLEKQFGKSPMPSYKAVLSASELDDLVAYLASLRSEK